MTVNPEIKIDKKGLNRIISSLYKISSKKYNNHDNLFKKQLSKNNNHKYKIRNVNDKDINHYLLSRNLKINRKVSINQKKINTLNHYLWWLNTKRESFVLTRNDKRILYFFHEYIFLNKCKYWVGGWFPTSESCEINEILYALKNQLEITSKISKKTKWISVVIKNNRIAIDLIKNLGFKELKIQAPLAQSIKKKFHASKNFIYFTN